MSGLPSVSTGLFSVFVDLFFNFDNNTPMFMFYGWSVCYVVSDQSAVAETSSSEKNFIGQLTIVSVHHHRFDSLPAAAVTNSISMKQRPAMLGESVESRYTKGRPPLVNEQCPSNPSILSRLLSNEGSPD